MAKEFKNLFEYYGFTKRDERKYPVISRILKSLTPERIKKEIEAVQKVKLPSDLEKWVKEYEKVGGRSDFIWKWAYKSIPLVTFLNSNSDYCQSLWKIKFLIIMFITLLDDVADKLQNKKLLEGTLKIPFREQNIRFRQLKQNEKNYLKFTKKIWNSIGKTIKKYPRYKNLEDIFKYDVSQIINTMKYAYMVNKKPYLINKTEHYTYFPYNLPVILSSMIDLMYLPPKFILREIRIVREIAWRMQRIAQSINWITTWEREVKEKDLTSGIFAYALDLKVFTVEDFIRFDNQEIIHRIKESSIEKEILQECSRDFDVIENFKKKTKIDVNKIIQNLEKFIILQFSSKGYY